MTDNTSFDGFREAGMLICNEPSLVTNSVVNVLYASLVQELVSTPERNLDMT